jgi:hypothetical protein
MSPAIRPIGWRVICDCWASSSARRPSAVRLSIPVSGSITASARCLTSERMSTVWNIATAIMSAIGAITSVGSWTTAWAVDAEAHREQQDDREADPDGDAALGEARAEGHERDREPGHGRHVRAAAQGHAAGHDDLRDRPAREQGVLRALGAIHPRVRHAEDDHGEREGQQRPPAEARAAGHQRDPEHAEDRAADGPQMAVHVQHARSVDPVGKSHDPLSMPSLSVARRPA